MRQRPRILLADDHLLMLEGLRELLAPEFDVVGAVDSGRAALACAEELKPDVLVADISMPSLNGIELARRLRNSHPACRLVFLTMHKDAGLLKQALWAGAFGYVLKRSAVHELKAAIREALRGHVYVSPAAGDLLGCPIPVFLNRRRRAAAALTARQREIVQLVSEGKSLKEIASILGIAAKTVEFHKYRAMEVLGARTTAELIQHGIKHRIVIVDEVLHQKDRRAATSTARTRNSPSSGR